MQGPNERESAKIGCVLGLIRGRIVHLEEAAAAFERCLAADRAIIPMNADGDAHAGVHLCEAS